MYRFKYKEDFVKSIRALVAFFDYLIKWCIMPIEVKIQERRLGSFLKLRCMISLCSLNAKPLETISSQHFNVTDLAEVQLQFNFKNKNFVECYILAQNHIKAKNIEVKIKASCQEISEPFYSEWICDNQWKTIGIRENYDVNLNCVCTTLLDINISARKVGPSLLLNLYNDVDFTDFSLSTSEGSVGVHKACLAATSDVFRAMLSHEWKEKEAGHIQMKGVTLQTLKHLKDYIYIRKLPDDDLKPLLTLASCYLIDDLIEDCVSKLAMNSSSEDWDSLIAYTARNKIVELTRAILFVNPACEIKNEVD
ncbi:uncharacterized protein LOC134753284 [Cydia strobilella]|uniref:uncharacterized protein LOC134753284 n=1 Tax=Cydia strobilella TaxID=1100964 RepID=UPI003003B15C